MQKLRAVLVVVATVALAWGSVVVPAAAVGAATVLQAHTVAITDGNGDSRAVATTPDGRFVLFESTATDLAPVSGGHRNAFVWIRDTGQTVALTHANADVTAVAISDDGRWVTLLSAATDLVPNGLAQPSLYQLDRTTGATRRLLGASATGVSSDPAVSPDGRWVAFAYASAPGATTNIRVWDRSTGSAQARTNGDGPSSHPQITDDGSEVAFDSTATNLIAGAPGSGRPAVYHLGSGGTLTGVAAGNGASTLSALRPTGTNVTFTSTSTDLVTGPTSSAHRNVYVWNVVDQTSRAYTDGNGDSSPVTGRHTEATFHLTSAATDLVPGTPANNLYTYDPQSQATVAVTHGTNASLAIDGTSADGAFLVVEAVTRDLAAPGPGPVAGSRSDLYRIDERTGAIHPLTVGNGDSRGAHLTGDGRYAVFTSAATDLTSGGTGAHTNVFRADAGVTDAAWAKFVRGAYVDFLSREALPDEKAALVARLQAGTLDRSRLVRGLATSPEWAESIVRRLYQVTLGRAPDDAGLAYWIHEISTGHRSVASVAANFYAAQEYYDGIGGGTDASWIDDLYAKMLSRGADPGGHAYWVAQTASTNRVSVALRLYQSAESARARVTDLYQTLLNRAPDPDGLQYWAGRVVHDGDLSLAVNLASSDEFFSVCQLLF